MDLVNVCQFIEDTVGNYSSIQITELQCKGNLPDISSNIDIINFILANK